MNIDSLLHRPIAQGRQFDKLIPKVRCQYGYAGEGDTDLSIKAMKEVVEKFSGQMSAVASALDQGSLNDTVDAVFEFCYDHFQYKADEEDQMLRSPACSWSVRYGGIDCKSYTIIASSILRELGIGHYIRKIKQPGFQPTEFTHVYVVVPADQAKGRLDQGYHIIDGTVSDNQEPQFIDHSDLFMSGLKHYASLNRPSALGFGLNSGPDDEPTNQSGSSIWNAATAAGSSYVSQNSSNWFKKNISFKAIGGLLKNIGCWGGTAFDKNKLTIDMDTLTTLVVRLLSEANDAMKAGNMALFSDRIHAYRTLTYVARFTANQKLNENNWNPCTRQNIIALIGGCDVYHTGAMRLALEAWIDQFFVGVNGPARSYTSDDLLQNGAMPWCGFVRPINVQSEAVETFALKPGISAAPPFIATDYVYSIIQNPQNFSTDDFLKSLATFYNVATNPTSIFTGGGTTQNGTGGGTNPVITAPTGTVKPSQAGTNVLMGALILGGLVWAGMEAFGEDKPLKKAS